jgi:hypothetical protein
MAPKIGLKKQVSVLNLRSHSISTFNRYDRRISTFTFNRYDRRTSATHVIGFPQDFPRARNHREIFMLPVGTFIDMSPSTWPTLYAPGRAPQ